MCKAGLIAQGKSLLFWDNLPLVATLSFHISPKKTPAQPNTPFTRHDIPSTYWYLPQQKEKATFMQFPCTLASIPRNSTLDPALD